MSRLASPAIGGRRVVAQRDVPSRGPFSPPAEPVGRWPSGPRLREAGTGKTRQSIPAWVFSVPANVVVGRVPSFVGVPGRPRKGPSLRLLSTLQAKDKSARPRDETSFGSFHSLLRSLAMSSTTSQSSSHARKAEMLSAAQDEDHGNIVPCS